MDTGTVNTCTEDCTADCGACKGLKRGDPAYWHDAAVMVIARVVYRGRVSLLVEDIFTTQERWVVATHCKPRDVSERLVVCADDCHHFFATTDEWVCLHCGERKPRR